MEKIEYKGYTIKIKQDEYAESPREWDNLGTMVCFHNRYILGDHHDYKDTKDFLETFLPEFLTEDENEELEGDSFEMDDSEFISKYADKLDEVALVLPLYLYDHSGLTMNTTGFSCPWDSGQVGIIYVTHDKIKEEYAWTKHTLPSLDIAIEKAKGVLIREVSIYDDFIRGNVYCFTVEDPEGNFIDSCGGFYGYNFEDNGLLDQARSSVDYDLENIEKCKQMYAL